MHTDSVQKISVVDFGLGNIGSIVNMLRRVGADVEVVNTPQALGQVDKLILPGVGHWDNALPRLDGRFREVLNDLALNRRIPILGICLGMQMLFSSSEEGQLPGLGWVPGRIRRLTSGATGQDGRALKIPHMGWNLVTMQREDDLTRGLANDSRFYFAHSYCADEVPTDNVLMTTSHGSQFACGVRRDNIWGVQFHPEKSHRFGMKLLANFASVTSC